jgi:hypothetical protein
MSGLGLIVLILAVAAAALDQSKFGFFTAGLGGSFIQLTCSLRVDGRRGTTLQLFILTTLALEVLTCFLAGGVRNEVVGFGKAAKVRAPFSRLFRAYSCLTVCLGPLSDRYLRGSWSNLDSGLPLATGDAAHPSTVNPLEAPSFPLQAVPHGHDTRRIIMEGPEGRAATHAETVDRSKTRHNYSKSLSTYLPRPAPTSQYLPGPQSPAFLELNSSNAGLRGGPWRVTPLTTRVSGDVPFARTG